MVQRLFIPMSYEHLRLLGLTTIYISHRNPSGIRRPVFEIWYIAPLPPLSSSIGILNGSGFVDPPPQNPLRATQGLKRKGTLANRGSPVDFTEQSTPSVLHKPRKPFEPFSQSRVATSHLLRP